MRIFRLGVLTLVTGLLLTSCEKTEQPVKLPAKGSAEVARVDMGEDYTDQVFFDFETNSIVLTNQINSWDLSFENGAAGSHIFINGGKDIYVYNTHTTDLTATSFQLPKLSDKAWSFDLHTGNPGTTAIGEWANSSRISKNEVYILKLNPANFADTFKKIQLVVVDDNKYVLRYGDMKSAETKTITINKESIYNYAYFSFDNGGMVTYPEPAKDSWDIVFTRYRHIYTELENFPYLVSGVLLNPNNTMAAEDSTTGYTDMNINTVATAKFYSNRDLIGFDWKSYDLDKGKYTVKTKKGYLVKTRKEQYYKLHFTDFYSEQGVKGSPAFEFERLQ
jgi:hypothetical protein